MAEMLLGNIKGKDGNGIKSAVLNADDTLTLTFDDGTSYTTPSIRGATGAAGQPGADGKDGAKGDKGDAGYTPVKGVDYWTDADREDMVQQVITALGTPVFGRVDADHNIILTGELADGTYTLKYEDAEGNATEIGTIEVGGVSYINQIPLSINADGTLYNGGHGWKTGYRLNSSGAEVEKANMEVTGFIPAKYGDVLRMRNVTFNYKEENSSYRDNYYIAFYDASFTFLGYRKPTTAGTVTENYDIVINDVNQNDIGLGTYTGSNAPNVAYIRISSSEISNDSIITINQEITD